jgi:hypothetical protein
MDTCQCVIIDSACLICLSEGNTFTLNNLIAWDHNMHSVTHYSINKENQIKSSFISYIIPWL